MQKKSVLLLIAFITVIILFQSCLCSVTRMQSRHEHFEYWIDDPEFQPSQSESDLLYYYRTDYPSVLDSVRTMVRYKENGVWTPWENSLTTIYTSSVTQSEDYLTVDYIFHTTLNPAINRQTEVYNLMGNLVSYINYIQPENTLLPYNTYTFSYDTYGNLYAYNIKTRNDTLTVYTRSEPHFDNLMRKITEDIYTSPDSVNWTQVKSKTFYYNDAIYPPNFSYRFNMDFFGHYTELEEGLIVPCQVHSVVTQYLDEESFETSKSTMYTYNINGNIGVGIFSMDHFIEPVIDYMPAQYGVSYNQQGYRIAESYSGDDGLGPIGDESVTYTWEEITAANDPVSPLPPGISLSLYPNPFSDNLNISIVSAAKSPSDIAVYNLKGQLIRQWNHNSGKELTWNGEDAKGLHSAAGIYFISVKQGNKQSVKKILKL